MKTFVEVHDQNLLHATLLKAVFALSEEFQRVFLLKSIANTADNNFNFLIKNDGSILQL